MFAVIMAGGRGTRFWPRSRKRRPKQLLNIIGEKTILEQTVDRIRPLCGWDRILVVTEVEQAPLIRELFPQLPGRSAIGRTPGEEHGPLHRPGGAFSWPNAIRRKPWSFCRRITISRMCGISKTRCAPRFRRPRKGEVLITLGIPPTFPETGIRLYRTRGSGEIGRSTRRMGGQGLS